MARRADPSRSERVETLLHAQGAEFQQLSAADARVLWRKWQAFWGPGFDGYHWHEFSFEKCRAVSRDEALKAYRASFLPRAFFILRKKTRTSRTARDVISRQTSGVTRR
jgi:hypothetical protein